MYNSMNILKLVVQLLSGVQLFATPRTVAHQASLSFTISWRLLRLMAIESVMLSNGLILCHPLLLLPSIITSLRVFSKSRLFISGGQSIEASASASVLPMNIQGWFPFGWTGLISVLPKELSRVIASTRVQEHQVFWRLFTGFNNSMALCSSDTLFPKYPSQSSAVGAVLSGSYDGKN